MLLRQVQSTRLKHGRVKRRTDSRLAAAEGPAKLHSAARRGWEVSTSLYVAVRLGGQVLEFIAWVLLARTDGPGAFGRLSAAFLISRYLGIVADWGASYRGSRDVATGDYTTVRGLLRRRTSLSAVLSLAFVAIALLAGYGDIAILAVVVANGGVARDWISLGHGKLVRASIPGIVQGLAMLLGAVIVARAGLAVWVVALSYLFGVVISIGLNLHLPLSSGGSSATDGWMLLAGLSYQVTVSLDTVMLAFIRSAKEAGIYAAVYRIPAAFSAVMGLAAYSLLPKAARVLSDAPERLEEIWRRSFRVALAVGVGTMMLVPLAYFSVSGVLGTQYISGRFAAAALMVGAAFGCAAFPLIPVYVARGNDRAYAAQNVFGAIINTLGNLLLIPRWGMNAASLTTVASRVWLVGCLSVAGRNVLKSKNKTLRGSQ